MKKITLIFTLILGLLSCSLSAQDIPLDQFDKRGVEVVNNFMNAIMNNQADEMAAAKAALPYIHKSEYDAAGTNLKSDRLSYSFKKAWQNAKFYNVPVTVTRVQKQSISAIGFGSTAQTGTVYKVWVGKKEGVAGLPAPFHVFFPSDGSAPTISNYGSL